MSVLNQSGEEQVECPLCMEPFDIDDLTFFPCTCGYQICRFCWHRIRTDENGLCPACRKAYSENPADFTPLSKEQVAQLKASKRQRDQQRKAKLSESRKHLANVRVVQKNLVFVVGLPIRLADAEVLKKHEYFGKFGKIHKVVINQSTAYAGSQGPSASAYVTYVKSDDALRAIQSVNNITIDGRLVKSSLGTTKYCSHFMKNQSCPKPDCMYLHDFGDPEASFTKEQMHAGKHQEYEKKLHDRLTAGGGVSNGAGGGGGGGGGARSKGSKGDVTTSTTLVTTTATTTTGASAQTTTTTTANATASATANGSATPKDGWPQLNNGTAATTVDKKEETTTTTTRTKSKGKKNKEKKQRGGGGGSGGGAVGVADTIPIDVPTIKGEQQVADSASAASTTSSASLSSSSASGSQSPELAAPTTLLPKIPLLLDDNTSFFSAQHAFQKITREPSLTHDHHHHHHDDVDDVDDDDDDHHARLLHNDEDDDFDLLLRGGGGEQHTDTGTQLLLNDSLPIITSTEDWEAAFKPSLQIGEALKMIGQLNEFGGFNGFHHNNNNNNNNNAHHHQHASAQTQQSGTHAQTARSYDEGSDLLALAGLYGRREATSPSGGTAMVNGGKSHMTSYGYGGGASRNGFTDYTQPPPPPPVTANNGYVNSAYDKPELLYMQQQQRQLEQQLRNLRLYDRAGQSTHAHAQHTAQQQQQPPPPFLSNGYQYVNGEKVQQQQQQQRFNGLQHAIGLMDSSKGHVDDELGFDPFHETQKALAELIENEQQTHKAHMNAGRGNVQSATNPMNGIVHNQGLNGHIPPPPPGFMHPNTHMNSFGSKFLPLLNMSYAPPISNSTQNNWPGSYNQLQQQPHKGLGTCNDWKVLDPAIVSSSRHFSWSNLPAYNAAAPTQSNGSTPRAHDYANGFASAFATASAAAAASPHGPAHPLNQYGSATSASTTTSSSSSSGSSNYNWVGEVSTQIAGPPGFRAGGAAPKQQQEC